MLYTIHGEVKNIKKKNRKKYKHKRAHETWSRTTLTL